jgi:hypothetical protein
MNEDTQFSEEGMAFSEITRDLLVTNMAVRMVIEARCEAILDILGDPPRSDRAGLPTAEALRGSVAQKAAERLDRTLAALADDNPSLVSAIHRTLHAFLPPGGT